MQDKKSVNLIRRIREGDAGAATELFDRYVQRLMGLVRKRLSPKLTRRIDPDDVLQSAYLSFFMRARDGRFDINESGELWRLLAAIAINKVLLNARYHRAGKRRITQEESVADGSVYGVPVSALSKQPTPEEAAIMTEELTREMAEFSPLKRQIVQMWLQGFSVAEIAVALNCTRRMAQRTLQQLQASLREQLSQESSMLASGGTYRA
jgi:RNA polymerase sigma-70 factor (ECF subfamily)